MTDLKMLEDVIKESGMTMVALAKKSGIKRETLYNRLKGVGEFKISEMTGISRALNISDEKRDKIFFAGCVESYSTE